MSLNDIPLETIDGRATTLAEHAGQAVLVVNVASRCGLTPQYTALEQLQENYGDERFTVLGFPSNQFGGQEPGTADEIQEFCSTTYGVSFPLYSEARCQRAAAAPALRRADREGGRGRLDRRYPVELREVPCLAAGRGRRPVPAQDRAR